MPKTFTSADLGKNTGEVTKAALRSPVFITRHNKPTFVMMSYEDYERRQAKDPRKVFSTKDMPDEERALLISALQDELKDD